MTSSTVRAIAAAFQDEGFAPSPDCTYEDSSIRRVTTQEYLEAVDWTDLVHVTRALRAFERLLEGFETQYLEPLCKALRRDGYLLDDHGEISRLGTRLSLRSLPEIRDPTAIQENINRIQRAFVNDPAQAVGSAKELLRKYREDRTGRARPYCERTRRSPCPP